MKPVKAKVTKGLPMGSMVPTCDNSGAKMLRVFGVKGSKTVKGRYPQAGVGDLVVASVRAGKPEMRKQQVYAVIVRQKRPYRRADGTRIKFQDNVLVICAYLRSRNHYPVKSIFSSLDGNPVADFDLLFIQGFLCFSEISCRFISGHNKQPPVVLLALWAFRTLPTSVSE